MPPGVFASRSCGFASCSVGEIYGPVAIAGGDDAEEHSDLIQGQRTGRVWRGWFIGHFVRL